MDRSILTTFSSAATTLADIGDTFTTIGNIANGKDSLGILNIASDPTGWLVGAAVDKLVDIIINAIKPLKRCLDALLGDAGAISGFVGSVQSKGAEIQAIAGSVLSAAEIALDQWQGEAAQSFEASASQLVRSHAGANGQLQVQAMLTQGVGTVTAALKETVMGIVKKFVKDAVTKALMALASSWCSFGATLAAFAAWMGAKLAQTLAWVAKTFSGALAKCVEIGGYVSKAASVLSKATSLFGTVMDVLDKVTGGRIWNDSRNLSTSELGSMPGGYVSGVPSGWQVGTAHPAVPGDGSTYGGIAPTTNDYALHQQLLANAGNALEQHFLSGSGLDYTFDLGRLGDTQLQSILQRQMGTAAAGADALIASGMTNFSLSGPAVALPAGMGQGLGGGMAQALGGATLWTNANVTASGQRATMVAQVNTSGRVGIEGDAYRRMTDTGLGAPFNAKGKAKKKVTWIVGDPPVVDGVFLDVAEAEYDGAPSEAQ